MGHGLDDRYLIGGKGLSSNTRWLNYEQAIQTLAHRRVLGQDITSTGAFHHRTTIQTVLEEFTSDTAPVTEKVIKQDINIMLDRYIASGKNTKTLSTAIKAKNAGRATAYFDGVKMPVDEAIALAKAEIEVKAKTYSDAKYQL